jgi:hypothetical protein
MQVPERYILISKIDYEHLLNRLSMMEARIKELEGMLKKDSSNNYKSASSGGYKKKVQNNREK